MTPEQRAAVHAVCRNRFKLSEVTETGVPMLWGRPLRLSPRDRLWIAFVAEALLRFVGAGQSGLVQQLDDLARAKVTQKRIKQFRASHVLVPYMVDDYSECLARYAPPEPCSTANAGEDLT